MKTLSKLFAIAILIFKTIASSNAQPTDNVAGYYPFNGNVNDVTGNGKNCSNNGGATLIPDRLGKVNDAYSFNGSSNYLLLSTSVLPSSNAYAISCWFKPLGNHFSSDVASQVLVDLRGQYQTALAYNQPANTTNPNSIQFYIYSNPNSTVLNTPNNSIQVNVWSHIVASYSSNTMSIYINGNLAASQTFNPPSAVSGYNSTIGKDYAIYNNRGWVYGYIDEVLIYKRGLTSAEVQALYNRGLTSSEIPELYAPIKYSYDASGNRNGRNLITLKSAPAIMQRDSAGIQAFDGNNPGQIFEDSVGDQKVVIYPNPTQGQLKIDIMGYEKVSTSGLYLYNLSGKLLISKQPANSSMPLDLSSYPNGTYLLKIVLGDKTSEWKIVKE